MSDRQHGAQGHGGPPRDHHGQYAPVPVPGQPAVVAGRQMKRRNPVAVWLGLPIITFGIYGVVWHIKIHSELGRFDPRMRAGTAGAVLSLFFGWLTLGIWNLVVWVKLGGHIAGAQRAAGLRPTCGGGLGFLLGLIGFGALYYQIELNKVVDRYGRTPPGTQVSLAV